MSLNYALDYYFNILFCPNSLSPNTTKVYSPQTGKFTITRDGRDRWMNSYKIDTDNLQHIIKLSYSRDLAFEPEKKENEWLRQFKVLYDSSSEILFNKQIAFNMFILKMKVLGFSEEFAFDYIQNYYALLKNPNYSYLPNLNQLYKNIEIKIFEKEFWIPSNLDTEKRIELDFLYSVFKKKQELSYEFSFEDMCKEQYMNIIQKSIIPRLIEMNQTKSEWIINPLPIAYQIPHIIKTYELVVTKLIEYANEKYPVDNIFLKNLPIELKECVSEYLNNLIKNSNNTVK